MRKYYLIAELLIFKHRRQNISVSNTAFLTAVICSEVTCCENPFDILMMVMVSVAMSSLGHTDLFFIDLGTKVNSQYYRDVLLHQQLLPAIRDLSGDFFIFQQGNAPVHRVHETVLLLTCETPDFIAPALWPANSPDLNVVDYQTWGKHHSQMHDVDELKSHLIEEWEHFHQVFIDEAIRQWRPHLRACI